MNGKTQKVTDNKIDSKKKGKKHEKVKENLVSRIGVDNGTWNVGDDVGSKRRY